MLRKIRIRRSLLGWYAGFLVRHPFWILTVGIALTLASLSVALRLELRTSREELSDSFDSSMATYEVLVEEFG